MATDSVSDKHPLYSEFLPDWDLCSDVYEGERTIKEKGMTYLPPTAGQVIDGARTNRDSVGYKNFQDYVTRAVFPEFFKEAVQAAIGIMHEKPATINVPEGMRAIIDDATVDGQSIHALHRRINEQQLVNGRIGLLADVDETTGPDDIPRIAVYEAKSIINWDNGATSNPTRQKLNLVVLDESEYERLQFSWTEIEKYRALVLGDLEDNEGQAVGAVYTSRMFRFSSSAAVSDQTDTRRNFESAEEKTPSIAGNTLDQIPFVFINASDTIAQPEKPPMLGMANRSLAAYRGEADLRQVMHNSGDGTLVISGSVLNQGGGEDTQVRIGSGSVINVELGGDAKMIGIDSESLPVMRDIVQDDYDKGKEQGVQLREQTGGPESGRALNTRMSARAASLMDITLSGAEGLEKILKIIAEWRGFNPDEVSVVPNTDFDDLILTGQELNDLMVAKRSGAPLTLDDIHAVMVSRGLTNKTFNEAMEAIEREEPFMLPGSVPGSQRNGEAIDNGIVEDE